MFTLCMVKKISLNKKELGLRRFSAGSRTDLQNWVQRKLFVILVLTVNFSLKPVTKRQPRTYNLTAYLINLSCFYREIMIRWKKSYSFYLILITLQILTSKGRKNSILIDFFYFIDLFSKERKSWTSKTIYISWNYNKTIIKTNK